MDGVYLYIESIHSAVEGLDSVYSVAILNIIYLFGNAMGMLTSFVDPYIRNELKVLADSNPRRIHEFYSDHLLLYE